MPHYLLTGAGFSANWGGWVASEAFEYLLGCPEIMADQALRDLLWKYQASGGFEDALAELQTGHAPGFAQQWSKTQLIRLQGCVGRMFDDMNQGFLNRGDHEFARGESIRRASRHRRRAGAGWAWPRSAQRSELVKGSK